jgi:hypothetical protein
MLTTWLRSGRRWHHKGFPKLHRAEASASVFFLPNGRFLWIRDGIHVEPEWCRQAAGWQTLFHHGGIPLNACLRLPSLLAFRRESLQLAEFRREKVLDNSADIFDDTRLDLRIRQRLRPIQNPRHATLLECQRATRQPDRASARTHRDSPCHASARTVPAGATAAPYTSTRSRRATGRES